MQQHTPPDSASIEALTESINDGKTHLLLACSGSVATIKLPNIINALAKYPSTQLSIRVILTPSASRFLAGQADEQPPITTISSLPNVDAYLDADEWRTPWVRGAGILHIELRRWADILVIAPLSANTLAKIVNGFADSLLTSVVRAWDSKGELDANPDRRVKKRRILVAPAMNTAMWRHPMTAKQLRVLEEEWGVADEETATTTTTTAEGASSETTKGKDGWFEVLLPQKKVLACGDAGDGAMMEWSLIVGVIEERLGLGRE